MCSAQTGRAPRLRPFALARLTACFWLLRARADLPRLVPAARYAFNIIFNILNKSTLNAFPCPWLISALQLGAWAGPGQRALPQRGTTSSSAPPDAAGSLRQRARFDCKPRLTAACLAMTYVIEPTPHTHVMRHPLAPPTQPPAACSWCSFGPRSCSRRPRSTSEGLGLGRSLVQARTRGSARLRQPRPPTNPNQPQPQTRPPPQGLPDRAAARGALPHHRPRVCLRQLLAGGRRGPAERCGNSVMQPCVAYDPEAAVTASARIGMESRSKQRRAVPQRPRPHAATRLALQTGGRQLCPHRQVGGARVQRHPLVAAAGHRLPLVRQRPQPRVRAALRCLQSRPPCSCPNPTLQLLLLL